MGIRRQDLTIQLKTPKICWSETMNIEKIYIHVLYPLPRVSSKQPLSRLDLHELHNAQPLYFQSWHERHVFQTWHKFLAWWDNEQRLRPCYFGEGIVRDVKWKENKRSRTEVNEYSFSGSRWHDIQWVRLKIRSTARHRARTVQVKYRYLSKDRHRCCKHRQCLSSNGLWVVCLHIIRGCWRSKDTGFEFRARRAYSAYSWN